MDRAGGALGDRQALLPLARVRPQGGGVANIDDEAVFAAIIYGWSVAVPGELCRRVSARRSPRCTAGS